MASQTGKFYLKVGVINPNEQKVILHMAFHKAFIVSFKHVWLVSLRNDTVFFKMTQNNLKMLDFHGIMLITLQVLLELAGILQHPGHMLKGLLRIP